MSKLSRRERNNAKQIARRFVLLTSPARLRLSVPEVLLVAHETGTHAIVVHDDVEITERIATCAPRNAKRLDVKLLCGGTYRIV